MVPAVPDLPPAPGRPARRPAPPPRRRPLLPATSCSTGRWRWSTTTWPCGPRPSRVLRRLATAGRLAMGPWYILMDEFLVSGETMIRDLQLGLDRAADVRRRDGGRLPARHVRPRGPDAAAAVAVRVRPRRRLARRPGRTCRRPPSGGAPPTARRCGPSTCPTATATVPRCPTDGKELVAQIERFERTYGPLAGDETSGPLLWMNGTDHQMPQAWLGRVVAEADGGAGPLRRPRRIVGRLPRRSRRPTDSTRSTASCAPVPAPTC